QSHSAPVEPTSFSSLDKPKQDTPNRGFCLVMGCCFRGAVDPELSTKVGDSSVIWKCRRVRPSTERVQVVDPLGNLDCFSDDQRKHGALPSYRRDPSFLILTRFPWSVHRSSQSRVCL